MDFCRVALEAHRFSGTIYVAGFLGERAASCAEDLVRGLPSDTRILRADLRAVELIDPDAFVRLARVLNHWRDRRSGRVTIEFPHRSSRRNGPQRVTLDQPVTNGMAVSAAMI